MKLQADSINGLIEVDQFDSGIKIFGYISKFDELNFLDEPFEGTVGFEIPPKFADDINMMYGIHRN